MQSYETVLELLMSLSHLYCVKASIQVRVRLTFNTIKGMILKNEFSMIRLSFGENWELGLRPILMIEP
jgi:hypothetical protein